MPHAQAAFPILTIEEIISGCAAVGCAILESDFRQPVAARIQAVYETWMAHSLGINAEDCIRAVEDHLAQMEHAVSTEYTLHPTPSATFSVVFVERL